MKSKYYESGKFKASLIAFILFLGGTAGLLYFTITDCLQQCTNNTYYPTPCLHDGKSFCCAGSKQNLPSNCLNCVQENDYCTQFIVGSAGCFILAAISLIYLCMVRRVHLKNVERSNWSGMASLATYKGESEENAMYRRQK